MEIFYAAESDIGNLRKNNQDNLYCNGIYLSEWERDFPTSIENSSSDELQFYAVCDGMGGEQHGELASLIAVNVLPKYHKMLGEMKYHSLSKYMDMYFSEVTSQICEMRKQYDNCRMGTTIAMIAKEGSKLYAFNIGDSRIYKFSKNKLVQVSEDHTASARAYKMGMITKEEMKTHQHRNKLTQYLGLSPEELKVRPSRANIKVKDNDRIVICSDGITDMMSDDDIAHILSYSETPSVAAKNLVQLAKNNGGRDNITAIVLGIKTNKKFLW